MEGFKDRQLVGGIVGGQNIFAGADDDGVAALDQLGDLQFQRAVDGEMMLLVLLVIVHHLHANKPAGGGGAGGHGGECFGNRKDRKD